VHHLARAASARSTWSSRARSSTPWRSRRRPANGIRAR
jgi:hypothetical protein